jgi:hypothetical protein
MWIAVKRGHVEWDLRTIGIQTFLDLVLNRVWSANFTQLKTQTLLAAQCGNWWLENDLFK